MCAFAVSWRKFVCIQAVNKNKVLPGFLVVLGAVLGAVRAIVRKEQL